METEHGSKTTRRIRTKLANLLGSSLATIAVFVLGSSVRGRFFYRTRETTSIASLIGIVFVFVLFAVSTADWLFILVNYMQYAGRARPADANVTSSEEQSIELGGEFSLRNYHLQGLPSTLLTSVVFSFVMYFTAGTFLHVSLLFFLFH